MHFPRLQWISCLALVAALTTAQATDWPHWRGPDHDGISRETGWNPAAVSAGKAVWKAEVGAGYSCVSVSQGKVYTTGNFNKNTDAVLCLDEASGKTLWRHEYPEPLDPKYYSGGCSATPTVHGGKVYTLSKKGKLFCLDAATGKVLWNKDLRFTVPEWGFAGSALVQGQAVILNAGSAGVAYDKDSGAVLWESEDDASAYATPVPFEQNGQKRIALFAKDSLLGLQPQDGKVLWSFPWKTRYDVNAADPVISGSQAFITSGYGHGAALVDFSSGQANKVWENKNMRAHMSGPVLIDGHLYGFDDNKLTCLAWKTGAVLWSEKSPKKGALSAAGDKLIVIGESGRLAIVEASPAAYRELAAAQVVEGRCWTMPVLANGRIYVRNSDGRLVCLDVR